MHVDLTVLWYQNDLWKAFFTFQGSISVGVDATDLFDNYNLIDSFNERWVLFLILDCSQSITSNTCQIETINSLKHSLKISFLVSNLRVLPNIEVSSMSISQSIEVLDEYMYIVLSEVLVCSITKYFTSYVIFGWVCSASQNVNNKYNYRHYYTPKRVISYLLSTALFYVHFL